MKKIIEEGYTETIRYWEEQDGFPIPMTKVIEHPQTGFLTYSISLKDYILKHCELDEVSKGVVKKLVDDKVSDEVIYRTCGLYAPAIIEARKHYRISDREPLEEKVIKHEDVVRYMNYEEALDLYNQTNNMETFSLVVELNLCQDCKHSDCPSHNDMDDNEVVTSCRYYVSKYVCQGCKYEGHCDNDCEEGEMFYPKRIFDT